jgi:hypothetical protein
MLIPYIPWLLIANKNLAHDTLRICQVGRHSGPDQGIPRESVQKLVKPNICRDHSCYRPASNSLGTRLNECRPLLTRNIGSLARSESTGHPFNSGAHLIDMLDMFGIKRGNDQTATWRVA